MNQPGNVDPELVLRARVLLLSSTQPTRAERLRAYRVLATVSPAAHLPRLVRTLLSYAEHEPVFALHPDWRLAHLAEAVRAARAIDPTDPYRDALLTAALDAYEKQRSVR